MKKTITILLVLLVAAFAVFATDYAQTVKLQSAITAYSDFQFQLGYGTIDDEFTYLGGDPTSSTSSTITISADEEGVAYFNVRQGAELNLNSDQGTTIDLDVTVTDWYLDNDSTNVGVANQFNEIAMALTLSDDIEDDNDDHNVVISGGTVSDNEGDSTATVTLAYTPGLTALNTDLFDFTATWEDKNLVAGDYTSTVTLSYTAN